MMKFKSIAGYRSAAATALLAASLVLAGPVSADRPPAGNLLGDAFAWLEPPTPAPEAAFLDAEERETSLRAFRGQVVLLNFWATWCAPCIREMPSLDRLQAKLGAEGFTVVAVSEDFKGREVVVPFFEGLGLNALDIYMDPDGVLAEAIGIGGLPTTLLIDRDGRILGGLEGPAEWDSDEAIQLIRHFLDRPEET